MNRKINQIKKALDSKFGKKIQVSMHSEAVKRKEGERWVDYKGLTWEMKDGKKQQVFKVNHSKLYTCKDCDKLILKQKDEDTYNRFNRCFYCQINFEVDLKAAGEWKDWVIGQETERWKSIEKDVTSLLKEMSEEESAFDTTVANALANENIARQKRNLKT